MSVSENDRPTEGSNMKDAKQKSVLGDSTDGETVSGPLKITEMVADRYSVIALLVLGKTSAVYKVEQTFLKQKFALKTLSAPHPSANAIRQFQIEAHCASKLSHPNLAKAHDFGLVDAERPFYVMDLIEGQNLFEYSKNIGTLSVDEVLHIFIPISYALDYANGEGILHGDLKPESIILVKAAGEADYTPKVIDFAGFQDAGGPDEDLQSKVSADELLVKALYVSPEKSTGKRTDHRSDIYSLGCVMYEALTGAPPFHAETAHSLMQKHRSKNPPSLKETSMGKDYPPQLEAVMAKALAKDPEARYQSFVDLANDLLSVRHPEAVRKGSLAEIQAAEPPLQSPIANERETNWKLIAVIIFTNIVSIIMTCFLMTHFLHQETTSEKLSSDTHDYINDLTTARSMFMTVVGKGQSQKRVFHFPTVSLGKFSYFDAREARWFEMNAQGEIALPMNCQTKFETEDRILAERPNTLRLFGPNDITNLTIRATRLGSYDENISSIIDAAMAFVSRYTSLTQLIENDLPVTDVGVRCLSGLPNLIAIDLSGSKASISSIKQLKNYKILTMLKLGSVNGAKQAIPDCVANPNLRILSLSNTDLDDQDLESIAKIPLHVLEINGNPKVTDKGLHSLSKNPQFIELALIGTSLTPACINDMTVFKSMHSLHISVPGWKRADLAKLKSLLPQDCRLVTVVPDQIKMGFRAVDWEKELN